MLMTSAPSRLPASSKEVRVRVEFSKNRLMTVRPRSSALLLVRLPVLLDIALGEVEQEGDLVRRKPLDSQQMAMGEGGGGDTDGH